MRSSAEFTLRATPCLAALALTCPVASQAGGAANLAVAASPSASYVSGDTTLEALHDGAEPARSSDARHRTYGNWNRTGTQWVQYDWPEPVHTGEIEVYWWDDHRGVRLPDACRLLQWDGERFVPVEEPEGLGVEADRFNRTTFQPVWTTRLRLEIDGNGGFSTGVIEWRVMDAGDSPRFPPRVSAGTDRFVVRGSRTQLRGQVSVQGGDGTDVQHRWTMASGPGEVTFDQPDAVDTPVAFSSPGTYELTLTSSDGGPPGTDSVMVEVVSPPAGDPLLEVPTLRFNLDSPLWRHRARALVTRWIPHCIERISDPELKEGGLNNLLDAAAKLAGKPHGEHRGYVFSNAWVFNVIESMCVALLLDPAGDVEVAEAQQAMRDTLEAWIPRVLAAQEPDGYFQTAFTLSDRTRWSPRHRADHEGYVAGYFLEAAIAHHRLTGGADRRMYDAALRLADCWVEHIGPSPRQPWYDGHQGMELALVRFGRYVNEVEQEDRGGPYLALAKFLLDCRDGGSEYDQSHVPVTEQYEAVGHAVRAVYSYAAMAEVALETGDPAYQGAVASLWDNIVNRKYYLTGGIGSGETSEGFGPDYSLRHHGYCESCSSCGMIFMQHALNRTHADARYADLYEETLYNALLGSIDLEGGHFYYQNPLVEGRRRYAWHVCPCCVGNIPRTLLMLPTWMYVKGRDALYVNLFIGSTATVGDIAGTDVEIVQATDYPWKGEVALTVNPARPARFRLCIRSPQRDVSELYDAEPTADGIVSVRLNDEVVPSPRVERGYLVLERTWRSGDRVEFALPMAAQRVQADPKVASTRGMTALRYGPLVYNVETVDQDLDAELSPKAPLRPVWDPDLLGGAVKLTGSWSDGSPLLAVPHYARMNRLPSEENSDDPRSAVWISSP